LQRPQPADFVVVVAQHVPVGVDALHGLAVAVVVPIGATKPTVLAPFRATSSIIPRLPDCRNSYRYLSNTTALAIF
jgi:hypothetical protein